MNAINSSDSQSDTLKHLLESQSGKRSRKSWIWIVALLAVASALTFQFLHAEEEAAGPKFKTEKSTTHTLVVTVSATGNLQPTNQVDVGSELSGIIDKVFVDVNDQVQKGQILARLDLSKLQDAVAKSQAYLASTKAQVLQAKATVAERRAELNRLLRVAELSAGKLPSGSEMDAAEAALKRAEADEAVANANVTQALADVKTGETNLHKASLRSSIDGVVLARQVEPGQTVAASFQAPVLFTLAEDLAKMELQVDVDEADVSQVRPGQKATFTVDAWPGRVYEAVITRISFGAQVKENVVSYVTVLDVDNKDLSLRPGMTGTAEIITVTRENALLVPNAALRFSPPDRASAQPKGGRGLLNTIFPRQSRPTRQAPQQAKPLNTDEQLIWILHDGRIKPLHVRTGASNGRVTEIVGGELEPSMDIVTETIARNS